MRIQATARIVHINALDMLHVIILTVDRYARNLVVQAGAPAPIGADCRGGIVLASDTKTSKARRRRL